MILAKTTIDYFLSILFRDYLQLTHAEWMALLERTPTEETAALDLPDSLKRYGMDVGKDAEFPSIICTAREPDGNTPARRVVHVSCILQTWLKAADAEAAAVVEQLTREESAAIQIAIENRLRDLDAFNAWLLSLPDERREGWCIMGPLQIANTSPVRGEKPKTIDFATTIKLTVAVARLAA